MPNHCAIECRSGTRSVAAVKNTTPLTHCGSWAPSVREPWSSTWLEGCWDHVGGCAEGEAEGGIYEAAQCVVTQVAQTGKASAKPEYSLGIMCFFFFSFVCFHKKKLFPCTWFLCSVQLLLESMEVILGSDVPRTGSCMEKRPLCFHQVLPDNLSVGATSANHSWTKIAALVGCIVFPCSVCQELGGILSQTSWNTYIRDQKLHNAWCTWW